MHRIRLSTRRGASEAVTRQQVRAAVQRRDVLIAGSIALWFAATTALAAGEQLGWWSTAIALLLFAVTSAALPVIVFRLNRGNAVLAGGAGLRYSASR